MAARDGYVGSVRSLVLLPHVALNLDEIQQSIDALISNLIRSRDRDFLNFIRCGANLLVSTAAIDCLVNIATRLENII
jgi:hypothetical protein